MASLALSLSASDFVLAATWGIGTFVILTRQMGKWKRSRPPWFAPLGRGRAGIWAQVPRSLLSCFSPPCMSEPVSLSPLTKTAFSSLTHSAPNHVSDAMCTATSPSSAHFLISEIAQHDRCRQRLCGLPIRTGTWNRAPHPHPHPTLSTGVLAYGMGTMLLTVVYSEKDCENCAGWNEGLVLSRCSSSVG